MRARVPGDKSLTQRALILASLAEGESRLAGLLHGGDAASTARALRSLGAEIPPLPPDGGEVIIRGVGLRGLCAPKARLDLRNSGTGTRLLMGVLAGCEAEATLTGDTSLRQRPMARVIDPLSKMGARFRYLGEMGRLPVRVHGRRPLQAIDWPSQVASAQVKSSILLAGLTGGAYALVTEPRQSRDHTERLFRSVGVSVVEHAVGDGWRVEMRDPPAVIRPLDLHVPGDISSAAFLFAAAAMGGAGDEGVTVEHVGLNPTRTAFLDVLERMGARIDIELEPGSDAPDREPVGQVTVRPGGLRATTVRGSEIPRLIDELPLIAVLGARAVGTTKISDAEELRTKESDRIHAVVRNLRTLGVEVAEYQDGLDVHGSDEPIRGAVRAFEDHRIAMGFGILNTLRSCTVEVDDPYVADVSFPGFWALMTEVERAGRRSD